MGLILALASGASLGATLGEAVAVLAGISVETSVAVGTFAGAGVGFTAYCVSEEEAKQNMSYCY